MINSPALDDFAFLHKIGRMTGDIHSDEILVTPPGQNEDSPTARSEHRPKSQGQRHRPGCKRSSAACQRCRKRKQKVSAN